MTTWLSSLNEQLNKISIDDLVEPDGKIEDGEHYVGTIDDDLRKLFHLHQLQVQKGMMCEAELRTIRDKSHREKQKKKIVYLEREVDVTFRMFWCSCMYAFPETRGKDIGIREGWKLVWFEPKPEPTDPMQAALLWAAAQTAAEAAFTEEYEEDPPHTLN